MKALLYLLLLLGITGCNMSGLMPGLAVNTNTTTTVSSSACYISSFVFTTDNNPSLTKNVTAYVNGSTNTVTFSLPYNVWNNQLTLVPTITYSTGATISPSASIARNYVTAVSYTVTAADKATSRTYSTSSSLNTDSISTAAEISTFKILRANNSVLPSDLTGTVDSATKTITITIPASAWGTSLTPVIGISEYATIDNGGSHTFTTTTTYTVTAGDGVTSKNWYVVATEGS